MIRGWKSSESSDSRAVFKETKIMSSSAPTNNPQYRRWNETDVWVFNQLTFKTPEQANSWKKAIVLSNEKHDQFFEDYFVFKDNTPNTKGMAATLMAMIEVGCMEPFEVLEQMKKPGSSTPTNVAQRIPLLESDAWVLDQFTFKTIAQYAAWGRAINLRNKKHGQRLEDFFFHYESGLLNLPKMLKTLDGLIEEGCMDPFKELSKQKKRRSTDKPR